MSPTMQKILKKFDHVFDSEGHEDPLFLSLTQDYREFLQRACVEYAKSIIPEKCEEDENIDTTNSDDVFRLGKESAYNDLIDSLHATIQQDQKDLPPNQ